MLRIQRQHLTRKNHARTHAQNFNLNTQLRLWGPHCEALVRILGTVPREVSTASGMALDTCGGCGGWGQTRCTGVKHSSFPVPLSTLLKTIFHDRGQWAALGTAPSHSFHPCLFLFLRYMRLTLPAQVGRALSPTGITLPHVCTTGDLLRTAFLHL